MSVKDDPTIWTIREFPAIDVHAHFGINCPKSKVDVKPFGSGDAETVARRARQSNIRRTIVSPLRAFFPRGGGDVLGGNTEAAAAVAQTEGLLQWVVIHPLEPRSFTQAEELVKNPRCVGIKIHPEEHLYEIKKHGQKLFEFAAKHRLIVSTHSGESRSMPEDFVPFADAFPEVRLILAHLGCTCDDDPAHQVRAVQQCKHGNIYIDTSSAQNIVAGLLEWAVQEIGADRILFGTDSPLYFLPMQRARIDCAEIAENDKRKILSENAVSLFGDLVS
jgi:uncharacterized protein